jgi:hypothetical protein
VPTDPSRGLRRPRNRMPAAIRARLSERGVLEAYRGRPPYQRNDYLGWIGRAVRPETREQRIVQMLEELAGGDRYMKMRWSGGR